MFVLLAVLAFVLFAPAVLLPILREHCNFVAEEKRLTQQISDLERDVQRRQKLAEAFAHDAVINERLAQLDLHYQKPGEIVVSVLPGGGATATPPAEPPLLRPAFTLPDDWPPWAHDARQWADDHGLIGLFLDSTARPVFLLMAAGLVIAAFVLFAPNGRGRPAAAASNPPGFQGTHHGESVIGTSPKR